MSAKKVPALKFTAGGAPLEFSYIAGVPGLYHPDFPTPVGEGTDIPLPIAELFDKQPGCPVELVHITAKQAEAYRSLADSHRRKVGR